MPRVTVTTASIPAELEQYKESIGFGLYKLVKGAQPSDTLNAGGMKKVRIKLTASARQWLEDLVEAGMYESSSAAIRDALLVVRAAPRWAAQAKL